MIFGYARVSTEDQNPKLQTDALEAAGAERVFVEYASGKLKKRPELEKLMEQLREGDEVLVYKIDRLSRSLKDAITFCERIINEKAGLRCLTEPFDFTTPAGRAGAQMLMVLAELVAANISENTKRGLAVARAEGRVGGRPPALSKQARNKVHSAYKEGTNISQLARDFGVSRNTIQRVLRNL